MVLRPPKRTLFFRYIAKDARNSPVQACSPVQRFLRGWFCGIASTNSSHTIPANVTPVDSTVEAPPSLPLLCHSLTRLPHPHGAQVLVAADGSVSLRRLLVQVDTICQAPARRLLAAEACQWHCSSSAKRQRVAVVAEAHVRVDVYRSLSLWPQVLSLPP